MSIALVNLPIQLVPLQIRNCARTGFMIICLSPYDWMTLLIGYMSARTLTVLVSPPFLTASSSSRRSAVLFIIWSHETATNVIVDVQIIAEVVEPKTHDFEDPKPAILSQSRCSGSNAD